jgi:uroporphyrinogen decarboxylase
MVHDSERAADVTLQPIRRYGQDAAVIFCDILIPPAAMGMDVEFIEGRGPVLGPPLRDRDSVEGLNDFAANEATGFLAQSIKNVRAELGEERAIIGFCGAPFTVASYMVEGQSSRNFENTKQMMLGDPETFDRLLGRVTDNSIGYLKMQADAGADALQIFDSWGGTLSAETYRERLLPHVARLVAEAKSFNVPVILYVNGCAHLLEVMADSGADVLGIDWRVDPAEAIERVGDRVALQGNMDPCTLFAPPDVVRREAAKNLAAFKNQRGYIFNLGSGILPKTPLDSVQALWETVLGSPEGAAAK